MNGGQLSPAWVGEAGPGQEIVCEKVFGSREDGTVKQTQIAESKESGTRSRKTVSAGVGDLCA